MREASRGSSLSASFGGVEPCVGLTKLAIECAQGDALRLGEEREQHDAVAERQEHEYHDREHE